MRDYVVVGTAGHIDHGKTELVKFLTGINPDRLKEEQERGITIELGFAYLPLPSGITASFIDVPGHERLVRKMIAGSYGLDIALLIVDAHEGIRPQTREHLDILNLLGIEKGIVVITKKDLVDEDTLLILEEEIKAETDETFLKNAPMVITSARTGEGMSDLIRFLDKLAQNVSRKNLDSPFRLFIDRVFSLPGHGTIITGTSYDGKISKGSTLEILPKGLRSRVRSIEVHKRQVEEAVAGERVALNLPDVKVEDLDRGDVVCEVGSYTPTTLIDVHLKLLPLAKVNSLNHGERVRFYSGSQEAMGRIYLSKAKEIERGKEGFVQISLEEPVVVKEGDRFILRTYSPIYTVGGGRVIEPHATRRRKKDVFCLNLEDIDKPRVRLIRTLEKRENLFLDLKSLAQKSHLSEDEVVNLLKEEKNIIGLPLENPSFFIAREKLQETQAEVIDYLIEFHKLYPHYQGVSMEKMRNHLQNIGIKEFRLLIKYLVSLGLIRVENDMLRLPQHQITFPEELLPGKELVVKILRESGYSPPDLSIIFSQLEKRGWKKVQIDELFKILIEQKIIIKISPELVYLAEVLLEIKKKTIDYFSGKDTLTPADFKEILGVSRKYAIPLMEWLDWEKVTYREGNVRKLRK